VERIGLSTVAAVDALLMFPAALFLSAVGLRHVFPAGSEAAHAAQDIVMWYAGKGWTLWILLVALPVGVFGAGCAVLPMAERRTPATLIVDVATGGAAISLAVVVAHMLAN